MGAAVGYVAGLVLSSFVPDAAGRCRVPPAEDAGKVPPDEDRSAA